jgi:hypothetical protein
MTDQNIELSKEGIKISYLRFLSDSAAGQIVILIAVLAYYFPVFGPPVQQAIKSGISTEVKILVVVLLVLLSSPLGLAINAASWFLLSWLQVGLQHYWFKEQKWLARTLCKHTREEFQTELTKNYFNLSERNWYARTQLIKQTLHIYRPYIINSLDHIRGIRTLFRNISFLALAFFLALLIFGRGNIKFWVLVIWFSTLFIIPMLISSLLGFHFTSHVLYRTYILMRATGEKLGPEQNFNERIISVLSREATQQRKR